MIVDIHTHVFPPHVRDHRDDYLSRDATFRQIYANPRAAIATADDVLAEMAIAGVDRSVICSFAWSDPDLCRESSDYVLAAAAGSGGRLIPFVMVHPGDPGARQEIVRCARIGARGIGELRPDDQGYPLGDGQPSQLLGWAAAALDLALLFHVSEPVGHPYPGKAGLAPDALYRFVQSFPEVRVIAAHWGGGLPFYALMPEVREAFATTYFDTSASRLLYDPAIYRHAAAIAGADRILFGSDFPLTRQASAIEEVRGTGLDEASVDAILGGNAAALLGLTDA